MFSLGALDLIALGFGLLNGLLALLGSNRTQPHSFNS